MAPSSRFAVSLKPNVAYLDLNLCALWKKQTTLPPLAYAGIPYQVFGVRAGALALTISWSRLAMARSGFRHLGDLREHVAFPVRLALARARFRLQLLARSFIAARSSSVNPLDCLPVAVVLLVILLCAHRSLLRRLFVLSSLDRFPCTLARAWPLSRFDSRLAATSSTVRRAP